MKQVTKTIAGGLMIAGFVAAPASFAGTSHANTANYNNTGANVSQTKTTSLQPGWAPGYKNKNIHTTSTFTHYLYLGGGGK